MVHCIERTHARLSRRFAAVVNDTENPLDLAH